MDRVEPDFSGAAVYALSTIPLVLAGDSNAAIERLSHPIASYYRLYANDPGTNEYRTSMRKIIREMARTNPIVAESIERKALRDDWQELWVDGLGTYASVKVERFTNASAKARQGDPANGSQPTRSGTNSTSPTVGTSR